MRFSVLLSILLIHLAALSQSFSPVSPDLQKRYTFNLQKNFFKTQVEYDQAFKRLAAELAAINSLVSKKAVSIAQFQQILFRYNAAETAYRKIDLYLFLRYVTDVTDERADKESDSLRALLRNTKQQVRNYILAAPRPVLNASTQPKSSFSYFIKSVLREEGHVLTSHEAELLRPFQYVNDPGFYDKAIRQIRFGKVQTTSGEVDVFNQMSAWQSDPDSGVRREGQIKLFKGYATQKESIGYGYINMVKGLNALSKARGFKNFLDEKLFSYQISPGLVESFFFKIKEAAQANDGGAIDGVVTPTVPATFTITEATRLLEKAFAELGPDYSNELHNLLDPGNGRMDIVGGKNRYPLRGAASVYPLFPSVFYAHNYEGYLIDLILLAHESGHAVQASLMTSNRVPMVYGAGPGYFTESFGKFNELLLFDYLSGNEQDTLKKKFYQSQLRERIDVLYGSAEEACIEYALIDKIISGQITVPQELDSMTLLTGAAISPKLYAKEPERKNLWMVLETNFHAPLHNVNDMIGAALAIAFYKRFKEDKDNFVKGYYRLLREGYNETPDLLLKKVDMNIADKQFIEDVISFAKGLVNSHK